MLLPVGGRRLCPYALAGQAIQKMTTDQVYSPKVVRDIVLTYVVLHNMLRSHQGGADRKATPADDIQSPQNDQGEQGQNENIINSSREAKHQ